MPTSFVGATFLGIQSKFYSIGLMYTINSRHFLLVVSTLAKQSNHSRHPKTKQSHSQACQRTSVLAYRTSLAVLGACIRSTGMSVSSLLSGRVSRIQLARRLLDVPVHLLLLGGLRAPLRL